MIMSASTPISNCCQAVIRFEKSGYCCSKCMKPCQSDGTLGDLAKANIRQRAERAARNLLRLVGEYNDYAGNEIDLPPVPRATDIIAAEFEK